MKILNITNEMHKINGYKTKRKFSIMETFLLESHIVLYKDLTNGIQKSYFKGTQLLTPGKMKKY